MFSQKILNKNILEKIQKHKLFKHPLAKYSTQVNINIDMEDLKKPLTESLKGIPDCVPTSELQKPKTLVTTLPNGLQIATEETYQQTTAFGIYVFSGTRNETEDNIGVSHLLDKMAFKSTSTMSASKIMEKFELLGAQVQTSSSKDMIYYMGEFLRIHTPEIVKIFADTIHNSKFDEIDIEKESENIFENLQEMETNPEYLIPELLHAAAYKDQSMGRIYSSESFRKLGRDDLIDFMKNHYVGKNMVVAACGVEHEEFTQLVTPLFSSLPSVGTNVVPYSPPIYTGGEFYHEMPNPGGFAHVALGLNCAPLQNTEEIVASFLLGTLLGGGSSFSAGGPGKGMFSRLYSTVLNRYQEVENINSFLFPYNDTSLFGISGSCLPNFAGDFSFVICEQLAAIATRIDKQEFERAKKSLKSTVSMNLESRNVLCEDIAKQVSVFGRRIPVEELNNHIDNLTIPYVINVAKQMLSYTPSLVAIGDNQVLSQLPSLQQVEHFFSHFKK